MDTPRRVAIVGADWPVYEKFCPNFTGMQLGLQELGIEHRLFSCRPDLDVAALIAYRPDLVVYGLIDMARRRDWRLLIRAGLPDARIVMWYGDLRNGATGQVPVRMDEIDLMFVSNAAQGEFYRDLWKVPDCRYLPLGSPVYDVPYQARYDFDFVFIGAQRPDGAFGARAQEVWQLKTAGLKTIDVPASQPSLRAKVLQAMPAIYRSSRISLDQSHFTDIEGYTSNRFFIVTGSGGFALTRWFPGCEDLYPIGTRAYFRSVDESIELKDYYLAHPGEREQIRAAGYLHARNHTYDHRFRAMFAALPE